MKKDTSSKSETKPYNGSEIFVLEEKKEDLQNQLMDEIEKIIYPQAKAYGAQDGNHKRP